MVNSGRAITYELGDRFPSAVDLCCATASPTMTGVLANAAVEVAELRSMGVWVEGAIVG